jgi:hypothetical protein
MLRRDPTKGYVHVLEHSPLQLFEAEPAIVIQRELDVAKEFAFGNWQHLKSPFVG